jgi:hypothetical protein
VRLNERRLVRRERSPGNPRRGCIVQVSTDPVLDDFTDSTSSIPTEWRVSNLLGLRTPEMTVQEWSDAFGALG